MQSGLIRGIIFFEPQVLSGGAMETHPQSMVENNTAPQIGTRKVYEKPKLEILGDVRAFTLGGSAGSGESGGKYPMKV
jgi:hypothetical protein